MLRIEKGHPAGGELNGQTTAHDLGIGKMLSAKKDFIGRVHGGAPGADRSRRGRRWSGSARSTGPTRLRAGAHLLPKDAEPIAKNDQGYVTSIAFSPSLGHWLGLGAARPRAGAPRRDRARLRPGARRRCTGRGAAALLHRSARRAPPCLTARSVPSRRWPASPSPDRYGRPGGEPGVIIAERVGLGLATVAARKGAPLRAAVKASYGVDLPDGSAVAHGPDVSFVGYGPGQWLAVSETLANEALARDLAQRLKGLASISDQSGGRTVSV